MTSLDSIHRVRNTRPPSLVIYGPPGVGKSSLAAEFPAPVFLQINEEAPTDIEIDSFGKISNWLDVYDSLKSLASHHHDYRNVVIDSIDYLEPLIWNDVCVANGWESIAQPNIFGAGYIEADKLWRKLFRCLDYLRDSYGIGVILIAHSTIINNPNPAGAEFPRWDIRIQKRARGIVEDSVNAMLMVNYDYSTVKESTKSKGPAKSSNSTLRWIHCAGSPAMNAKNRYGMPDKILYNKGEAYTTLSQYFPGSNTQPTATEGE